MRGNKRTVTVKLVEKEYISNQRLIEYFAKKYMEGRMNNDTV